MHAEWSAECAADDPVLVVPWSSALSGAGTVFVDLSANPYDLDLIPEAERHPPLMQALRALNAPRSPVFTAKCDAWPLDAAELAQLRLDLDLPDAGLPVGFASYIDLVFRERLLFLSFHQQEQTLRRLVRLAAAIDQPCAALECVLRPALVDLAGPQEGYAVSLYVKALGTDEHGAGQIWSAALEAVVALIRGKDLVLATKGRARTL